MATGVVKSIETDRSSATIIQDSDSSLIETTDVANSLVAEDGVSYDVDSGKAKNVKEITKVTVKGTLNAEETGMLQSLIKSINGRGGGGDVSINIKTKM